MWLEYLKFFLIGIFGGVVSGLLGIGGGIIMVPILIYFTQIEVKAATAISAVQILFSSTAGSIFNSLNKTIRVKYALYLGLSSMAFSFLGSFLTRYIHETIIMSIYVFTAIAVLVLFLLRRNNQDEKITNEKNKFYIIIPFGAVAGFIGGLLGFGGGFLFVPILTFFFNFPLKIAVGTSLAAVVFNSIPGVIGKLISVKFNVLYGVIIGIGAVGGSRLGTYLNKKLKPVVIKILFSLVLAIAIIRVIIDLLNIF
jgi:uncharacterized protein